MNETRVLIIATTRLGYDGITSVLMNYYKNIDKSKIQFDFIPAAGIENWVNEEILTLGGKIYNVPSRKKNIISYMLAIKKIIKNNKYKIVHMHGNSATLYLEILAAKLAKSKFRIAHCHNSTCTYKIIHYMLKKRLNKDITHAFACSKLAGEWLYNRKFYILNNGIDIEKFKYNEDIRSEYRKQLGLDKYFVIGHIGHFSYQKNHEFLLDVFSRVYSENSKARLLLIGEGELESEVQSKINSLGLQDVVMRLGKRNDNNKLLQAMDVFVLPSRFEGLPVVLVEAQTAGLFCVVSDVITEEAKLTEHIKYLSLDDSIDKWSYEINSRKNYKRNDSYYLLQKSKFNVKNEAKRLEEFYLEIIN